MFHVKHCFKNIIIFFEKLNKTLKNNSILIKIIILYKLYIIKNFKKIIKKT